MDSDKSKERASIGTFYHLPHRETYSQNMLNSQPLENEKSEREKVTSKKITPRICFSGWKKWICHPTIQQHLAPTPIRALTLSILPAFLICPFSQASPNYRLLNIRLHVISLLALPKRQSWADEEQHRHCGLPPPNLSMFSLKGKINLLILNLIPTSSLYS